MSSPNHQFITLDDYLMGWNKEFPLTQEQIENAIDLLVRINHLIGRYGFITSTSSGYRPPKINTAVNGAKRSAHLDCMAIDLVDKDRKIAMFLNSRREILEEYELYMEHPDYTKSWCHLQTRETRNRVFIPK